MSYHDHTAFTVERADFRERRCYPRFPVDLSGVCSIVFGADVACTIGDLSLGVAALRCKAAAAVGDKIVLSMPHLGLLGANCVRVLDDGFAVAFDDRGAQRARIKKYLVFTLSRNTDPSIEGRGYERIVPLRRVVRVTHDNGRAHMARIIDASRSGVAVSTTVPVAAGLRITIGSTAAETVRVFEGGFAARFLTTLDASFDAAFRF